MEEKELKRNAPHDAWPKDVKKYYVKKGGSITFTDPETHMGGGLATVPEDYVIMPLAPKRTLYDGRYCAVSGFVFNYEDGWRVLANKRGEGAPDYKHCWNVVCGFLEADETDREGISREVLEETGFHIPPDTWEFQGVETDPRVCNNGNVSLRFTAVVDVRKLEDKRSEMTGGEENEVESVKWIYLDSLDDYQWAFNHKSLIPQMLKKLSWWEKAKAIIKSHLSA